MGFPDISKWPLFSWRITTKQRDMQNALIRNMRPENADVSVYNTLIERSGFDDKTKEVIKKATRQFGLRKSPFYPEMHDKE